MANLIRSAKSGSDWTKGDLDAYNIRLTRQDIAAFFGIPALPEPQVPAEILTNEGADGMTIQAHAQFIHLLDDAMIPPSDQGEESAVDDFAVELLKLVGYTSYLRYIRTHKDIPLSICGESRHAKTDVCIIDRAQSNILLLVQEDKRLVETPSIYADAEAQLIAEAIAAFAYNNEKRLLMGLPELQEKIMPGIVMIGTTPRFYKVPVTQQLVFNIVHGIFPAQRTEVSVCEVPIARGWNEGMKPLDNRRTILACYEAFKAIVGIDN